MAIRDPVSVVQRQAGKVIPRKQQIGLLATMALVD
jgi:hypothetical protein